MNKIAKFLRISKDILKDSLSYLQRRYLKDLPKPKVTNKSNSWFIEFPNKSSIELIVKDNKKTFTVSSSPEKRQIISKDVRDIMDMETILIKAINEGYLV